jgi:hypothetical protein
MTPHHHTISSDMFAPSNSPQIQTRFDGRSRCRSLPNTETYTRSPPCRVIAASSFSSERVEKRLSLRQRRNGRRQCDGFTATIQTAPHSTLLFLTTDQPTKWHIFLPSTLGQIRTQSSRSTLHDELTELRRHHGESKIIHHIKPPFPRT